MTYKIWLIFFLIRLTSTKKPRTARPSGWSKWPSEYLSLKQTTWSSPQNLIEFSKCSDPGIHGPEPTGLERKNEKFSTGNFWEILVVRGSLLWTTITKRLAILSPVKMHLTNCKCIWQSTTGYFHLNFFLCWWYFYLIFYYYIFS